MRFTNPHTCNADCSRLTYLTTSTLPDSSSHVPRAEDQAKTGLLFGKEVFVLTQLRPILRIYCKCLGVGCASV